MKYLFLTLFFVSSIGVSKDYSTPYEQPMVPQNQDGFDLDPLEGGEINLNSTTNIEGKAKLKSDLEVTGETKLNGDVKFKPYKTDEYLSLKNWHKEYRGVKNSIDGKIKTKNDEAIKYFRNKGLKPYIDFDIKKSLIGKFEGITTGVQINPVHQMSNFNNYSGDISVPKNKDVFFLANMKKGDIINRILIDGRTPEQGRKLTIFNNNASHIGFKISSGDGTIVHKVGGVKSGGTIYLEPTQSFTLVYSNSWWVRIGGYSGVKAVPENGDTLIREIKKTCKEGIHCLSTCPKGERLIGSYCSLLDDDNALEASGSYRTRGIWRGQCRTKHPTIKGIHLQITCEKFRYPD